MVPELLPGLSTGQLQKHLIAYDQIGNKWAGTPGERRARDYIFQEMRSYGLETRLEEFPFLKYSDPQATVTMVAPFERELNCLPVAYYANKEIEGELVYVGGGSRQAFELLKNAGVDFAGKIVVAVSDVPFMVSPYVQEYGAVGLLTLSDAPEPGMIRHCSGAFYGHTAVPRMPENPFDFVTPTTGAMIALDPDGHMLLSLMSAGRVSLRISNRADYSLGKSWNIIGEIKGVERPEEQVIIGGHYDTEFGVPGAWDNGTGTAAVLETARAIKESGLKLKRSMVFISFGCEENGLWGSADYTKRHEEDLRKNAVAFFNLDCPAGPTMVGHSLWVSEAMKDFMVETAETLQWRIHTMEEVSSSFSDYAPFRDLDIPNVWAWTFPPVHPYYHTAKDTLEYAVRLPELTHATEVTAAAALALATTDRRL